MWKFATSIMQKLVELTPLKAFFKYGFQRLSNDFLDHEPNIDFKKGIPGELQLIDLPLSAKKINQTFLMSSPYILQSGVIRKLKITLPNLSEIAHKSIEIEVSGLELVLYPNKDFCNRFNEEIKRVKEMLKFYDVDENVRDAIKLKKDEELDFFKEIIKQILTNIKVNVNNVSVRLFMNTPSQNEKNLKPQYYVMLRVPAVSVERSKEELKVKSTHEVEKYQLKVHQVSLHLLREDIPIPQYDNIKSSKQQFPSLYPPVSHPSTLLLIGNHDSNPHNRKNLEFSLTIQNELETRTKRFGVEGVIPNIQVNVEPYQLRILSHFLIQLKEFGDIYKQSLKELKRQDVELYSKFADIAQDPQMRQSRMYDVNLRQSMDIFTSVAFRFQDIPFNRTESKPKQRVSYLDAIFTQEDNESINKLKAGIKEIEMNIDQEMKDKIKEKVMTVFNNKVKVDLRVRCVRVYVQKYSSNTSLMDYERVWTEYSNSEFLTINQHIPASYFMFSVSEMHFQSQDLDLINMEIKRVSLLNVKLTESKQEQPEQKNDFEEVDVFKSFSDEKPTLWDSDKSSNVRSKVLKNLVRFEREQSQHYCANHVLWVGQQTPTNLEQGLAGITHSYLPRFESEAENPNVSGVNVCVKNDKESRVAISIGKVGVVADCEIIKDMVNIAYPLFTYKTLAQNISLKQQEINTNIENPYEVPLKSNINHSVYNIELPETALNRQQSKISKKVSPKQSISLEIMKVYFVFADNHFGDLDLIHIHSNQTKDRDSFKSQCFCAATPTCINLELDTLQVISGNRQKILFKSLSCSIAQLQKNKPKSQSTILSISSKDKILNRVYLQSNEERLQQSIQLYIPKIKVDVQKEQCLKSIKMAQKIGLSFQQLHKYYEYLQSHFKKIESSFLKTITSTRTTQKPQQSSVMLSVYIQNIEVSVFNSKLYICSTLLRSLDNQMVLKVGNILVLHQSEYKPLLRDVPIDTLITIPGIDKQIPASQIILGVNLNTDLKQKVLKRLSNETNHRAFEEILQQHEFSIIIQAVNNEESESKRNSVSRISSGMLMSFRKQRQREPQTMKCREQDITIVINQPVMIKLCQVKNLVSMNKEINQVQSFLKSTQLMSLQFKGQSQTTEIPETVETNDIPSKMNINVLIHQISIDIFPYEDLIQSQEILSSTRSYLTLQHLSIEVSTHERIQAVNQKANSAKIEIQLKQAEFYFLVFSDKVVENNPLVMFKESLFDYGFKKICSIVKVQIDIFQKTSGTQPTLLQVSFNVNSIEVEISASSTVYLQYHIASLQAFADVLSYRFKPNQQVKKAGLNIVLIEDDQDQDDTTILIDDAHVIEQTTQYSEFKSRTQQFMNQIPGHLVLDLNLKLFSIKQLSICIFSGDEFSFYNYNKSLIVQETMLEFNDMDELVDKKRVVEGVEETKKRFRMSDANKYLNFRLLFEDINISFSKLTNPIKPQQLNIKSVIKFRSIKGMFNKNQDDVFYVLKTGSTITLLVQIMDTNLKIRAHLPDTIKVGYTSEINFIANQRSAAENQLKKLQYLQPLEGAEEVNDQVDPVYHLMVLISSTKLVINVKMNKINILNGQEITTKEFYFNNKLSKYYEQDNKSIIISWIKQTLTSNIGSVLTGTLLNLFVQAVWLVLKCLKSIIFLPGKLFR